MSTQYKHSSEVPTELLAERLDALSCVIAKGEIRDSELTMRVPAECDRDADIVLSEAAKRLRQQSLAPSAQYPSEEQLSDWWASATKDGRSGVEAMKWFAGQVCDWAAAQQRENSALRPLTASEIRVVATYAPEGVTDDEVAELVRRADAIRSQAAPAAKEVAPECGTCHGSGETEGIDGGGIGAVWDNTDYEAMGRALTVDVVCSDCPPLGYGLGHHTRCVECPFRKVQQVSAKDAASSSLRAQADSGRGGDAS